MWKAIQRMTVGWKQQFLQIVEVFAMLTFLVGLIINIGLFMEKNQFDSFPFMTLASLMIFITAHRLSGRKFLSTSSVSGGGQYVGPTLGAFLLTGAALKLLNLSGFLYGALFFICFLAIFALVTHGAKRLSNHLSKTESN